MDQEQDQELRKPVPLVHVDYTTTSGPQRLDALLPEEADKLKETPFAVVQVTHRASLLEAPRSCILNVAPRLLERHSGCQRHQDPGPWMVHPHFSKTFRMGPTACLL